MKETVPKKSPPRPESTVFKQFNIQGCKNYNKQARTLCACNEDNQHVQLLIVATLSCQFLREKEKLLALEVSQQSLKGHDLLMRML